jgi:hypothetical protein
MSSEMSTLLESRQSLAPGIRVRMSAFGLARHPKYGDRQGLIVGRGSASSWRVKFDERKSIQTIHQDYLETVEQRSGAAPSVQCRLARGPIGRGRRARNILEHCRAHPAEMGGQQDGGKQDARAYRDPANHRFRSSGPEESEENEPERHICKSPVGVSEPRGFADPVRGGKG